MVEQIIVGIIILIAAIYCIRNFINKFKSDSSSGCGGNCSCGSNTGSSCSELKTIDQMKRR